MWLHLINKLPLNLSVHPQDRAARNPLTCCVTWPNVITAGPFLPRPLGPLPFLFFFFLKGFRFPAVQQCEWWSWVLLICSGDHGTEKWKQQVLLTVRFLHWHWNITHMRTSGSKTDGYGCLQMLSLFCLYPARPRWRWRYSMFVI